MQLEIKSWNTEALPQAQINELEPSAGMRVLCFAPRICWPLDTGAKLRNYHLARVLAHRASVTLLAFADELPNLDELEAFCTRVITVRRESGYTFSKIVRGSIGRTPLPVLNYTTEEMKRTLTRVLEESDFDLVQIESIHLAEYLPIIRAARSRPRVICDWHNVESELMERYSEREANLLRRAYAKQTVRKMRELERRTLLEFDAHVVVSQRDAAQLRRINPESRIFVIENGVDTAHYSGLADKRKSRDVPRRVLFVGSMDYHANCDAVIDFARNVWPLLRARLPESVFTILGRNPSAEVRQLASIPGVEVTGTVDDVRPFYEEALAAVVPLRVGGGSRLKILEAMAAGVPVISTSLGAEGLEVRREENILIAETPLEFCNALTRIVEDPDLSERLVANGRALVNQQYDWSTLGTRLAAVHQSLIKPSLALVSPRPASSVPSSRKTIRLLAIVEATTVNAVAKNMLEFHRSARELQQGFEDAPAVELSLVTFDRSGKANVANAFINAAGREGLNVEVIHEQRRFDRKAISGLRDIVERIAPDMVLTHSVKSHFLIWRSRVWKRFAWIAFHHGYTTTDLRMRFYNRLDRWSLRHADRVVTVCRPFARELQTTAGVRQENLTIQHNSIRVEPRPDMQQVRELKMELGISENERIVLSVGRLSREKAHRDLLHAFSKLCHSSGKMDLRLVIVGDGPERANLQAESDSLGISDWVVFAGQVNNPHSFYAAADVLANPSHSEGSPYVLLEAMAAKVPVVATAVGGVPEILTHNESALLVPPDKPAAMAAAIEQVLNDSNLARRLVTTAADLVIKNHLPEQYARSLLTLYGEVLDARQRRAGLATNS